MERIARRAGVNKQLIFYYFGSKAGLFQAVVESTSGTLVSDDGKSDLPGGPLEQFRVVLDRASGTLSANADLLRATLLASETNEGLRASLGEELAQLRERIRALVSDAQGLGYVRDDVDPGMVAGLAIATVVGLVVLPGATGDQRFRREIDLLIRGLAW